MSERDRPFDELAAAIEADCSSPTFFADLVGRLHAVLGADATAAWILQPDGSLQLAAQANYAVVANLGQEVQQQLARVRQLAGGMQASLALPPGRKWVAPGVDGPTNVSPYMLLVTSIPFSERACGVLEVCVQADRAQEAVLDDLRLLMRAAGVASRYAILRQFRAFAGREEVWRKLDEFLRAVHAGSSTKEAAFLLANDGKRLLGCDRVMVILKRRGRFKIEAVSDRIDAEGHSNLASTAERLADCVARHGAPLVYDGSTPANTPADLASKLADYLKESPSRVLVAMPLADARTTGRKFPISAVLIVENVSEAAPPAEFAGRLEVLGKHAAVAVYQSLDRERVFLYSLWRWVGEWLVWPTATRRRLIATIGVCIIAVAAALAFIPTPLWLESSGELVPKDRRSLFAPTAGIVADVRVDHRASVQVGARVLTLDNPQLDRERLGLVGELEAKRVTRANLLGTPRDAGKAEREGSDRAAFRVQELDGEIELIRGKLAVVDRELASLNLTAPLAGEVLTWNPKERLTGKPVSQGQELLEIADVAGVWIVEIELAETVTPHVRRAVEKRGAEGVPVAYLISSAPDSWRTGRLMQLNLQGEPKDQDNVFRGRIALDAPLPAELRLAHAEIRCRIDCGSHSLGHVLFWRVVDWVRGKLLW